jgi:hypothetical protein
MGLMSSNIFMHHTFYLFDFQSIEFKQNRRYVCLKIAATIYQSLEFLKLLQQPKKKELKAPLVRTNTYDLYIYSYICTYKSLPKTMYMYVYIYFYVYSYKYTYVYICTYL